MLNGRVEVPEYGFAVTFPDDWDVNPLGTPDYGEANPALGPSSVLYAWDGPSDDDEATRCDIWVDASTQPPLTLAAYAQQRIRDFDVAAEYASVELPAGRGMRTTFTYDYDFVLGHTEYILAADDVFYAFACIGEDPPDDHWLSIAETIEFLPVEE